MPRQARLTYPGGVFHVISRCLNDAWLLDGPDERRYYLTRLEASLKRTDATLLAWAIMSNHVHLVVRAGDDPLYRLLKPLHVGFANWKNRREGRRGPVFSERYKTVLVDEDTHLVELIRYVHLNPLRAGVTPHPDDNDWTSHRAYAGLDKSPAWLDTTTYLRQFARGKREARARYREFIDEHLVSERSPVLSGREVAPAVGAIRRALGDLHRVSGPIVGPADFIERVLETLRRDGADVRTARDDGEPRTKPPLQDLIAHVCAELELKPEQIDESRGTRRVSLAKRLVTRIWIREYGGQQADIARHLNRPASIVSRWHSRAIDEARSHEVLYDRIVVGLPAIEGYTSPTSGQKVKRRRKARVTTVNVEVGRED